jgi:hypothetical protein
MIFLSDYLNDQIILKILTSKHHNEREKKERNRRTQYHDKK